MSLSITSLEDKLFQLNERIEVKKRELEELENLRNQTQEELQIQRDIEDRWQEKLEAAARISFPFHTLTSGVTLFPVPHRCLAPGDTVGVEFEYEEVGFSFCVCDRKLLNRLVQVAVDFRGVIAITSCSNGVWGAKSVLTRM